MFSHIVPGGVGGRPGASAVFRSLLLSAFAALTTGADSSAPLAPRGISATATTDSIDVNWYDNTETDLASYSVYRSTTSGGGFALLAQNVTRSYYGDTSARAGTQYYYCVSAVDTSGNVSPLSAQAWATIPSSNVPPAVPTGLSGTAGTNSISLDWNDNTESDLAGYSIYRSTTSGTGFSLLAEATQSAYADSAVQAGTTYYYIVFAFDTSGSTSAASAEVSVTVPAAAAGFFATIAWSAPTKNADNSSLKDLAGYKVYVGTSSHKYSSVRNAGKVTQFTVGPLAAGTYYFCVTAYDTSGNESAYSTEVSRKLE